MGVHGEPCGCGKWNTYGNGAQCVHHGWEPFYKRKYGEKEQELHEKGGK
jgi:hypothetical protein